MSQHSIVWEGLCASVPDGRGQRRVLQDAHGHALSGEPPSADAWVSGESEDDASDSESPLEGGILGILGPSGAGKTTLLRILAGHALPDAGRVLLDGAEYDGATAERIGYVPQRAFVLSGTVEENIRLGLPEDNPNPSTLTLAP